MKLKKKESISKWSWKRKNRYRNEVEKERIDTKMNCWKERIDIEMKLKKTTDLEINSCKERIDIEMKLKRKNWFRNELSS